MELLIGNKIRELRKSMHLTQEQLAEAAISEAEKALGLINAFSSEEKIGKFENYTEFFKKQIDRMKIRHCE